MSEEKTTYDVHSPETFAKTHDAAQKACAQRILDLINNRIVKDHEIEDFSDWTKISITKGQVGGYITDLKDLFRGSLDIAVNILKQAGWDVKLTVQKNGYLSFELKISID